MSTRIMGSTIEGSHGQKAIDIDDFFGHMRGEGTNESNQALYKAVGWIYRCLQLRCDAVRSIPYKIYKGDSDQEESFDLDLGPLLWKTEAFLLVYGASYWLKQNKSVN